MIIALRPNTVYLSGLETVKGFEFSRVFIVGIGDQFPAPDLPKEESWRDVRRLYVAVTRARDEVVLTYTDKKSPCLVGLEEFLSESSSAQQTEGVVSPPDFDQVSVYDSAATTPISVSSSNSVVPTSTPSLPVIHQRDSGSLVESLGELKLEVFDKRDRGGCLWVVGGPGLQPTMGKLKSAGFRFSFTPNGSRTTKHRPAWYLK